MGRRVTLVTGPPCSGKSTYAHQRAQPGDLVVCVDSLAQAAGSIAAHGHDGRHWQAAQRDFDQLCQRIRDDPQAQAWVIRGVPKPDMRQQLAQLIRATRVVLLLPPRDVLYARALERDDHDGGRAVDTCRAVTSWLRRYQPSPLDEVITEAVEVSA